MKSTHHVFQGMNGKYTARNNYEITVHDIAV